MLRGPFFRGHSVVLNNTCGDTVIGCLSDCLSVSQNPPVHTSFSVRLIRDRGSFLLWRQWNKLCTSGFVDKIIFSHNGPHAWRLALAVLMWGEGRYRYQVVVNFQRITQVAAHRLTLSPYILTANCWPGALATTTCGRCQWLVACNVRYYKSRGGRSFLSTIALFEIEV